MHNKINFVNSLTFQLEAAVRIFYGYSRESFAKSMKDKITLEEYAVLDTLVFYPHLNKNTLAKTLIRDEVFIAKVLNKLIKKKFIKEVKNNPNDIQVKYYELTKTGEKIYEDAMFASTESLRILLKFISENELLAFTKTLLKIRNLTISLQSQ